MPKEAGKYARWERERRYLLSALPKGRELIVAGEIEDVYLPNTRCRLRKVTRPTGEVIWKFTQKYLRGDHGLNCVITNIYLNETEAQLFWSSFEGYPLNKTRYHLQEGVHRYSIDVFHGSLTGLILSELDLSDEGALLAVEMPGWASEEVTASLEYTGFELALSGSLSSPRVIR